MQRRRVFWCISAWLAFSCILWAREPFEERPTPSLSGETGLYKVLRAETLCARQLTVQISLENWDRDPGDISYDEYALSFGYGLTDKLEASLSLRAVELSVRNPTPETGSLLPPFFRGKFITEPLKNEGTGNPHVGIKYNFLPDQKGRIGLAVHAYLELPRGDEEPNACTDNIDNDGDGSVDESDECLGGFKGTGKTEYGGTLVATKKLGLFEASLNAGYVAFDKTSIPNRYSMNSWITYGLGLRLLVGKPFQILGEIWGYSLAEDKKVTPQMAANLEVLFNMLPGDLDSEIGKEIPDDNRIYYHLGAQWQFRNGITLSCAGRYTSMDDILGGANMGEIKDIDGWGIIAKISYTSGCKVREVKEPRPDIIDERVLAEKEVRPEMEMANLPPRLRLEPEVEIVRPGQTVRIRGLGEDPEGEDLAYAWAPEKGRIIGEGQDVLWQAPEDCDEPIVIRGSVSDPHGASAGATTILKVFCPEIPTPIDRVFFEFDRYSITEEATAVLDRIAKQLLDNPRLGVIVEGHTCDIGNDTYNLALSKRRAEMVKQDLVGRGVPRGRVATVGHGEANPAFDNSAEETRRFNRRAEFRFSE
jgi:outer membrane protein OmpA-like peptidoglycan-associated protein